MKKIVFIILAFLAIIGLSIKLDAATSTNQAGLVATEGSNLNVRSQPSTSASIIGKVKDQSYLTVISKSGSFYYVEYQESVYGYVHMDYVNIVSSNAKKVSTNGSNLNVRSGPSTSYAIIEKVKDNDYVIVLSNSGSFSKVLFEGNKIGYVSNDYLVGSKYSAKTLIVPSYKQYDARWSYLTLGNYGKTIREIGCLTTSMAMSESYRKNATITPADIRNQSSYTSDGSLYWPSNYTTSTSSNYLSIIYNQLLQNKPVLIGLKNSYGGQHWVVVTGYVGGESLSASLLKVHDPASSTNTKLSEVMTSYPIFYKLAYYN